MCFEICFGRPALDHHESSVVVAASEEVVHFAALIFRAYTRKGRPCGGFESIGLAGLDGKLNGQSNRHRVISFVGFRVG
jgi:hypothetical protein